MTFPVDQQPPDHVWYTLEKALELLAVLADAVDASPTLVTSPWSSPWKPRYVTSAVDLRSTTPTEAPMPAEALRAPEAARRLAMPTRELLRLIYDRSIRYVMIDGIAHVPDDAIHEYRSRAASRQSIETSPDGS